jgi:hypothetical protein
VRWYMRFLILGLLAGGLTLPGLADEKKKGFGLETCGDFGTSVHFERSPKAAAAKAAKEEKLVFVMHISGLFEEPDYT